MLKIIANIPFIAAESCLDVRVLYINTQGPTSERDLEYGRRLLDDLGLKNFTCAKAEVSRETFQVGMEEVGVHPGSPHYHALSQEVFKVVPLKQECVASGVRCLLSGVRRGQTADRDQFTFIQYTDVGPAKAHPILDWTDDECLAYLRLKNIPPHPELNGLLRDIVKPSVADKASPTAKELSSSLRSRRPSRDEGKECGIHVQSSGTMTGSDPVPPFPNVVVGKSVCKFCGAAKALLRKSGLDFVEVPVHLFAHLVPDGAKTVPVVYLDKKLVGGYGNLCKYLEVEDTLNTN